jgi:hypothetical protein
MAEYAITITEKDIMDAGSYVNISTKEQYTRAVAYLCLEPVTVQVDDSETLPTMFRENKKIKAQYLMGMLATLLQRPFESEKLTTGEELTGCMAEADYDMWAGSHVMNQLERLKKTKDSELVNKLFDLLYDYKAFELMLTGAIRDELEVRNDPFNRAIQWFSLTAADAAVKEVIGGELRNMIKGDSNE